MSNIEKADKNQEIIGYVHPINNNGFNSQYKSFNTDCKLDDYSTTIKKSNYAKFNEKETNTGNDCPVCTQEALYECECEYKDKQCKNGHVWYINNSGSSTKGDPHSDE
jgi:hypothetical protein